jgi:hypothetical protein
MAAVGRDREPQRRARRPRAVSLRSPGRTQACRRADRDGRSPANATAATAATTAAHAQPRLPPVGHDDRADLGAGRGQRPLAEARRTARPSRERPDGVPVVRVDQVRRRRQPSRSGAARRSDARTTAWLAPPGRPRGGATGRGVMGHNRVPPRQRSRRRQAHSDDARIGLCIPGASATGGNSSRPSPSRHQAGARRSSRRA